MQSPDSAKQDELLTPAEVARIFRVDPKTVSRWAIAGKIKSVRTLGGHRRFYLSEIERVVRASSSANMYDSHADD